MTDSLTLAQPDAGPAVAAPLAVLGHPVLHSLSPLLHNAALGELAKADPRWEGWRYFRIDVPPEDLPRALELLHARGFHGLNLTVPHKVLACELVAEIDPAARPVGAVNTLRWTPHGWRGFNTDGYGLATALGEDLEAPLGGAHVLLLGAGGAARGAAVECLQQRCASLAIANRSAPRLEELLAGLRPIAGGIPLEGIGLGEAGRPSGPAAALARPGLLVINATSAGLRADDPSPLDLSLLDRPVGAFDMIYNPPETAFLRQAAALGIRRANGLSMLIHQGAKALEIWTGEPAFRLAYWMKSAARGGATA